MVNDFKKYAATGRWGYTQCDKDGKPVDAAMFKPCYPCLKAIKARDFAFSRNTP